MNSTGGKESGATIGDGVDDEVAGCLDLKRPRSFFVFAGAGSGKTRSLVAALEHVRRTMSDERRTRGQRVAVVTYTNVASEEIKRRVMYDPLIDVRTIHSFAWSLIEGLNADIRHWVHGNLERTIAALEAQEAKGRKGTQASEERLRKIESRRRRLAKLPSIKTFSYSPTGDNRGRDALNHFEVMQLAAHFLRSKAAMQSILVGRHPIVLIDESQDTNKDLIDALFAVEKNLKGRFSLGFFGDMMQRIFNEGKEGLGDDLPEDWATPGKKTNYRCPRRIVTLINQVRRATDGQVQEPRPGAPEGLVRLFVLPNDHESKPDAETAIAAHMANLAGDPEWNDPQAVKTLTLEHWMAADRMGFLDAFMPLYEYDGWRTSFLEGQLPAFRFFSRQVLPLVEARRRGDRFGVARLAKEFSPLLRLASLRGARDARDQLVTADKAVDALVKLWDGGADPRLAEILRSVVEHELLEPPDALKLGGSKPSSGNAANTQVPGEGADSRSKSELAIERFLAAPFSQIAPMADYLAGAARFDTHQGIKGLQFERVLVIMDDKEARGFSFNYEGLFGGTKGGKAVESTRRLFYVTASRAMQSLALVAYSSDPERVKRFVLAEEWFADTEVVVGLP